MKVIKYRFMTEVNYGSDEKPDIRKIFTDASLPYSQENLVFAKAEAYNGEVRVEDVPDDRPLEEIQDEKQEANKQALADWLATHPLTWTDGKPYGVTEQDQNEMALNLMQYQAAQQAGQDAPLEWHAQKEACRDFTQEEYLGLSMAISAYVYPYRRYQEQVKEQIYSAETAEAVEAVVIDYGSVQ